MSPLKEKKRTLRTDAANKQDPSCDPSAAVLVTVPDGGWTKDEADIAGLVNASYNIGIIGESSRSLEGGYYRLTLEGDRTEYTVCFGKDPDRSEFPDAERAIRASRFVSALMSVINRGYNCYIVPSAIDDIGADAVESKGLFEENEVEINFRSGDDAIGLGGRNYELEVAIFVAIDYENGRRSTFERFTDNVIINFDKDGRPVEYKHGMLAHSISGSEAVLSQLEGLARNDMNSEEMKRAATVFELVQTDEVKLGILEALSKPAVIPGSIRASGEVRRCNNDFADFLTKAASLPDVMVGQVSVSPSFLFIDALTAKTFVYDVTLDGNTAPLRITWNGSLRDFEKAPLYIEVTENGEFYGLSYDPHGRKLFDTATETLAVVPTSTGEGYAVTVAPREEFDGKVYKGVTNYALWVESAVMQDINARGIRHRGGAYLLREDLIRAQKLGSDNEWYSALCRKDDCAVSDYDGEYYHLSDMIQAECFLKKQDGSISFTRGKGLYLPYGLDSYKCEYCGSQIYGADRHLDDYRRLHPLALGGSYCDCCFDSHALVPLYSFKGASIGNILLPLEDEQARSRAAEKIGVFKCDGCGKYYRMPDGSAPGRAKYSCDCCGGFLGRCDRCLDSPEFKIERRSGYLPTDWVICLECKDYTLDPENREKLDSAYREAEEKRERLRTLENPSDRSRDAVALAIFGKDGRGVADHLRHMRLWDRLFVGRAIRRAKLNGRAEPWRDAFDISVSWLGKEDAQGVTEALYTLILKNKRVYGFLFTGGAVTLTYEGVKKNEKQK